MSDIVIKTDASDSIVDSDVNSVVDNVVNNSTEKNLLDIIDNTDSINSIVDSDVNSVVDNVVNNSTEKNLLDIIDKTDVINSVVDNVVNNSTEKNFLDIINTSLISLTVRDKLINSNINLSVELIEIIKQILSLSPDSFNDIEKVVNEIIKDGKINSKDIPQFIIVVQKIYQVIYSLKNTKFDSKKRSEIACSVLKYIVHLLVLERKIKIDENKEAEFFTDCDALIEACVSLISLPKTIKTKSCLKKILGL
jgi:hypothetical protein